MAISLDTPSRNPAASLDDSSPFPPATPLAVPPRAEPISVNLPVSTLDKLPARPVDAPPSRSAIEALEAIRKAVLEPDVDRIDRRLADLERRMEKNLADLNQRIGDSFAAFEKFVRQELQGTVSLVEAEVAEGERRRQAVQEKIDTVAREAQQRAEQMEKDLQEHDVATRREITRKGKEITDSVAQTSAELRRLVEDTVGKLDGTKADRFQIGDLLREMGERMHGAPAPGRTSGPARPL